MADYNPNQFEKPKVPEMVRVRWEKHEEWDALYVNGYLDRVGDSYLTDERISTLAGVKDIEMDFLRGGEYRTDAADTLAELYTYHEETVGRKQKADRLREQAQKLLDEADSLDQ